MMSLLTVNKNGETSSLKLGSKPVKISAREIKPVLILGNKQGPAGNAGDGVFIELLADSSLGGHRVIKSTPTGCDYANNQNLNDIGKVIGLTIASFAANTVAKVYSTKVVEEPSWSFNLGPVYLSTNGQLTQTIPTEGFIQQIGIALSPTKLAIQIQLPIKLN